MCMNANIFRQNGLAGRSFGNCHDLLIWQRHHNARRLHNSDTPNGCYTGLNSLQKHLMNTWIFVKIYSIFSLYDNYANKKAFFSYSFMSALRKWMSHNQMSLCSLYNEFAWIQMRFASYHRSLLIRNDKMRFHVQRLPACLSLFLRPN